MDNYIYAVKYFNKIVENDIHQWNLNKITYCLFKIFELEYFLFYENKKEIYDSIITFIELINNKPFIADDFLFYNISNYKHLQKRIFLGIAILFKYFKHKIYCIDDLNQIKNFCSDTTNHFKNNNLTLDDDDTVFIEYDKKCLDKLPININIILPCSNIIDNNNITQKLKNNAFYLFNNASMTDDVIKNICFTFDDGPHPEFTPMLLDILKKYNIKSTFFLIGKNISKYPKIVKRICDDGHEIGNHSWDHTSFFSLTEEQLLNQLKKTSSYINKIIKKNPKYFRPPYGHTNTAINNLALNELNLELNLGNFFTNDSYIKNPKKISQMVLDNLENGDIIVAHDTSIESIIAIEQIIEKIYNNCNCLLLSEILLNTTVNLE